MKPATKIFSLFVLFFILACDLNNLKMMSSDISKLCCRGLPGSGKSTLARKVKIFSFTSNCETMLMTQVKEALPQAEICSADHYFTDDQSGEYRFPIITIVVIEAFITHPFTRFDRSQLSEAHSACQATAEALCQVQFFN